MPHAVELDNLRRPGRPAPHAAGLGPAELGEAVVRWVVVGFVADGAHVDVAVCGTWLDYRAADRAARAATAKTDLAQFVALPLNALKTGAAIAAHVEEGWS